MAGRGLYRRWGITPRPEELMKFDVSNYSTYEMKNQVFLFFEIQTITDCLDYNDKGGIS